MLSRIIDIFKDTLAVWMALIAIFIALRWLFR